LRAEADHGNKAFVYRQVATFSAPLEMVPCFTAVSHRIELSPTEVFDVLLQIMDSECRDETAG